MILVDSGAPLSIVNSSWLEGYLKDAKVDDKYVKRWSCARRFRLRKTVYLSKIEVTFPVVLKTDAYDFVKRKIVANLNKF